MFILFNLSFYYTNPAFGCKRASNKLLLAFIVAVFKIQHFSVLLCTLIFYVHRYWIVCIVCMCSMQKSWICMCKIKRVDCCCYHKQL